MRERRDSRGRSHAVRILGEAEQCAQLRLSARYLEMSRPLPNSPRQHQTERSKV